MRKRLEKTPFRLTYLSPTLFSFLFCLTWFYCLLYYALLLTTIVLYHKLPYCLLPSSWLRFSSHSKYYCPLEVTLMRQLRERCPRQIYLIVIVDNDLGTHFFPYLFHLIFYHLFNFYSTLSGLSYLSTVFYTIVLPLPHITRYLLPYVFPSKKYYYPLIVFHMRQLRGRCPRQIYLIVIVDSW